MSHAKQVFHRIIADSATRPESTIAVFDLDSTIFDVSPRTKKILDDFLNHDEIRLGHPDEFEALKGLEIQSSDWGLKQAIERVGLKSTELFHRKIRDFWRKQFFSSDYLHFDRPYKGAIEYVKALANKKIPIYYLTGRDEENMKVGTIKVLRNWALPLVDAETHLIMKPKKGSIEDAEYKVDRLQILAQKWPSIWFFENEPVIIEKVVALGSSINVIYVDTTHSGRAQPPRGLPVISIDGWDH